MNFICEADDIYFNALNEKIDVYLKNSELKIYYKRNLSINIRNIKVMDG